jgi:succinate dehydrogenase / fumarate reductase, iron-sulfur subunit
MARYFLPQNSKIRTGVTHKAPQGPREGTREGSREGAREVRTFRIYRFDPDSGETPRLDSFELDIRSCGPMVLDALIQIKASVDSSVAFRHSCR